jgi:hypothetical protein
MSDVFTIIPASARPLYFLGAIAALLISMLTLFGYFTYSSRATRFEISPAGLSIRGTLYGRTIPWSSMRLDEVRTTSLANAPELKPTRRTNGVGLPGYSAGWFRLPHSGKGLLFVTDPARIVAVPTREGYTLIMSVAEPDAFVAALRRQASRPSS